MSANRYNYLEEVLRITTNDHMEKYVPLSINMNNTKKAHGPRTESIEDNYQ